MTTTRAPKSRARSCERCGAAFTVSYAGHKQRFCSRSCSVKSYPSKAGARNPRWDGGKTAHPLYDVYSDMLARCSRATHQRYARYGARGITVCARWRKDFWAFVADMGERPDGYSIDRIDNDGPYSPENCRWATASQQSLNRATNSTMHLRRGRNLKGQFA